MTNNQALDLRFTPEHEWVRSIGASITVGISDFAADQLGDMVFLEVPKVGQQFKKGQESSVVESVKAASDVYTPMTCVVTEVNDGLTLDPSLVNTDPFGDGWFFRADTIHQHELHELSNYVEYRSEITNEIEHIVYVDEHGQVRYVPSVRGLDGNIILGGSNSLRSILAHTFFPHESSVKN